MREWEMSHRHIHVFCECDYIDDYQIWKASRSSASQEVRLDLTNREEPRCSKIVARLSSFEIHFFCETPLAWWVHLDCSTALTSERNIIRNIGS